MRHHNNVRKFGREKNARIALVRGLAISLISHGRILTTEAKAKEIRPKIEKIITKAKNPSLSNRRLLLSNLYNDEVVVSKLTDDIAPRYSSRAGGYTRITKIVSRKSDGSPMAVIELI